LIHIPDDKLPKTFQRRKLVVFIDGNHLFHRLCHWYGTHNINIEKLSHMLSTVNRNLIEIRYYYSPFIQQVNSDIYNKQYTYVENIKQVSVVKLITGKNIKKPIVLPELMMGKLLSHFDKDTLFSYVEKGIDVNIAIDMVSLAHHGYFEDMILISGDSDFVPAITEVRKLHKTVQVAAFRDEENSCSDLNDAATSLINLHKVAPKLLGGRKKKATPKRRG
jgi:uncharacterized LabA/DUF88 family protein